jgi:hypothetical protein
MVKLGASLSICTEELLVLDVVDSSSSNRGAENPTGGLRISVCRGTRKRRRPNARILERSFLKIFADEFLDGDGLVVVFAPVGVNEEEGNFFGIVEAEFAEIDAEGSVGIIERPVSSECCGDPGLEFEHFGGGHGVPGILFVLGEGSVEELQGFFQTGWDSVLIQVHDAVVY